MVSVAVVAVGRLFFLQIVRGDEFSASADRQYSIPVQEVPPRGNIFFKSKDGGLISAATLKTEYILTLNPSLVEKPDDAYAALSLLVPISKKDFEAKIAKRDDPYEELAVFEETAISRSIKALELPGIAVYSRQKRFYPAGRLASHILGFTGKTRESGDADVGRYGIEQAYDGTLDRSGERLYENFFAEVFASVGSAIFEGGRERAGDIVTTIEPSVQAFVETELRSFMREWKPDTAGVIILEPSTGRIRAMASLPDFDPNFYGTEKDSWVFLNPSTERVYEMGSVMKPLTVGAGIDSGAITPQTTYFDSGSREFNGRKIANYDGKGRGTVNMQEVLNRSLNTGTVFIAEQMGIERFREYFTRYEFGEKTGVGLPGEVAGLVDNLQSNRMIEHATASFGQGIAMTPLSLSRALAIFANKGTLMRPQIVERITYPAGDEKIFKPVVVGQPVSRETAETVTRMLVNVVDEALLDGKASLPDYSVAAKTGTAQIADPSGGGYYDDKYLHSFFGYFPAYEPRFLVFLYAENPKGAQYASQTLTAPFMRLAKFLLNYYHIEPDRHRTL